MPAGRSKRDNVNAEMEPENGAGKLRLISIENYSANLIRNDAVTKRIFWLEFMRLKSLVARKAAGG